MKIPSWCALFVVFGCASSPAQMSDKYTICMNDARTQTAMHVCANEEMQRTDAELNEVYRKVLAAVDRDAAVVGKIKAVERAWIAYRDAYLDAMYPAKDKQAAYGSAFPVEIDLLRTKLMRQQISALNELLRQHQGAYH